jgi:hypothetical protein
LLIGETRAVPFPKSINDGEPIVSVALKEWDDPSGSKSEPSQLNVVRCAANADGVSASSNTLVSRNRLLSICYPAAVMAPVGFFIWSSTGANRSEKVGALAFLTEATEDETKG